MIRRTRPGQGRRAGGPGAPRLPRRLVRACALAFGLLLPLSLACAGAVESRLEEVRELQGAGHFAESVDPLRQVLNRAPEHPEANFLLGVALVQTGQPGLALWPLERAAASQDLGVAAGSMLAAIHSARRDHAAAIAAADGVLARDPDNVVALQVRAGSRLQQGDATPALSDAERAIALSDLALEARVLRVAALTVLGRRPEAQEARAALEARARELGDRPAMIRTCVGLAHLEHRLGLGEVAMSTLESCLERHPHQPYLLRQAAPLYDAAGRGDEIDAAWLAAIEARPRNLTLRAVLADRWLRRGESERALAILRQATRDLPEEPRAHVSLASLLQRLGRGEEAWQASERALAAAGEADDELQALRAELLIERGELERVEAGLEEIGSPVRRQLVRGRLAAVRGDDARALEAYESALESWPSNLGARFAAGASALRLGRPERARFHLEEVVRVDPGATDAPLWLARIALEAGEGERALAMARLQGEVRPTRRAEARVLEARAAAALGEDEAVEEALRRLEALPGGAALAALERAGLARSRAGPAAAADRLEASGLDLLAAEHRPLLATWVNDSLRAGRGDQALARLDAALERTPDRAELLDLRGRVALRLRRFEQARRDLEAAAAARPGVGSPLFGLAQLEAALGDHEAALARIREARAAGGAGVEEDLLEAELLVRLEREADAIGVLEAALERHPGHPLVQNALAWRLTLSGGSLDRALALAEQAARREPRPEVLDTLGTVRLRRGEAAAALATFRQALSDGELRPGIRTRLAAALRALGRTGEARRELERALGGGDFPEAGEARAALEALAAEPDSPPRS